MFQSAPAIDGGRSDQLADFTAHAVDVSIRARHRWRAIHFWSMWWSWSSLFQSAPAIDGGRSAIAIELLLNDERFQSAPAIDGGRSLVVKPHG